MPAAHENRIFARHCPRSPDFHSEARTSSRIPGSTSWFANFFFLLFFIQFPSHIIDYRHRKRDYMINSGFYNIIYIHTQRLYDTCARIIYYKYYFESVTYPIVTFFHHHHRHYYRVQRPCGGYVRKHCEWNRLIGISADGTDCVVQCTESINTIISIQH